MQHAAVQSHVHRTRGWLKAVALLAIIGGIAAIAFVARPHTSPSSGMSPELDTAMERLRERAAAAASEIELRERIQRIRCQRIASDRTEAWRPSSGTQLVDVASTGRGVIQVSNGTTYDAVVALSDLGLGAPARVFYLRSGETTTSTNISPGQYRLRFALGNYWASAVTRFCEPIGFSEFDRAIEFAEWTEGNTDYFSELTVTLHVVPDGRAATHAIDSTAFFDW